MPERIGDTPFKILKTVRIQDRDENDEFGESAAWLITIAGPARANVRILKRVLSQHFDTYCTHSYDCCGRWYYSVLTFTLRRIKSGTWTVVLAGAPNI